MNKYALPILVAFVATTLLPSCATAVRGRNQDLLVTSEPSNADVSLSSGQKGVTPVTFQVARKDPLTVTVSKAGFKSETIHLTPKATGGGVAAGAGNIIAGGIIGVGVDAATGAMLDLTPNPVNVTLQPQ